MKIDRRLLINFDWVFLGVVLLISAIGILNIYSASHNLYVRGEPFYIKQLYWLLIGCMLMVVTFSIDYHTIMRHAYLIYLTCASLLLLVSLLGDVAHGSQRWLAIFGFSFQPSELMKLVMVITLARYFSDNEQEGYHYRNVFVLISIVALPFVLIVRQPDLGTAMFLILIFGSIAIFIGVGKKLLLWCVSGTLVLAPLFWFFLKDYQQQRILTFLNPDRDPLGTGYHIIQSIIAVGSGSLFGKGFMKGTQTQLKFLPEQQTDFAFSVFAEEWGFVGVVFLMSIFLALILWSLKIVQNARDMSGAVLAFGVTMFFFWGILINIGMILGMFPVVGIPLPFFSYGGSSLVVLMIGSGLLLNVSMRRFVLHP